MFFLQRSPDYVADIERIGAAALAHGRAKQAQVDAQVDRHQQLARDKLKLLAVEQAITIERLKWPLSNVGPRIDDPAFKRKVQDMAAALLFQSHLHLAIDG
jgi:hypothetical protein